ncbi:unnamed protein product, partial [Meganyctiphanes norvegica]
SCGEPFPKPNWEKPGLVGYKHLTNCFDMTTRCLQLGIREKCKKEPYLQEHCRRSCRICTGDCWDTDLQCSKWHKSGLCSTDAYVKKRCPKTCFDCKGIKSDEKLPCQCGLPQHLLIPKGRPEGMPFQIFVYVTAFENQKGPRESNSVCNDVECSELCAREYGDCLGYPKDEAMGFPFDRPLHKLAGRHINAIHDLDDMLTNAKALDVNIFHSSTSAAQANDYKCHYEDFDEKLELLNKDEN